MTVACMALMAFSACGNKKFHVNGNITEGKDSTLYLENLSLNGPVTVDSVKLDANGAFDFSAKAPEAPEFYRLRIAGQIINIFGIIPCVWRLFCFRFFYGCFCILV